MGRNGSHQRYLYVVIKSLFVSAPLFVLAVALAADAATSLPVAPTRASFEASADRAHDGGIISGTVVGIDYVRGIMSLRADRSRTMEVYVLPSTNIQGKSNGYYTIADLKKGSSVEVFTSVMGTRTNAQIIKLK